MNNSNITSTPSHHQQLRYDPFGRRVCLVGWVGDVVWGVVHVVFLGGCCFGGGRDFWSRTICITNRQNTGLISVDRKTSLLSHVQYPVLYQSRLQRI